jgi:hypothetical protein
MIDEESNDSKASCNAKTLAPYYRLKISGTIL